MQESMGFSFRFIAEMKKTQPAGLTMKLSVQIEEK